MFISFYDEHFDMQVDNGYLTIRALREWAPVTYVAGNRNWTSARLKTKGNFDFTNYTCPDITQLKNKTIHGYYSGDVIKFISFIYIHF